MNKKLTILMIGLIFLIVAISGCTNNNSTNSSNTNVNTTQTTTKYFEVMGAAENSSSGISIKVPIRKTTDKPIYFYYTPYKNGIPETGSWCVVPDGIDTKKTFMLTVSDPNMEDYDSVDIRACEDEYGKVTLQKEHIIL